MTTANSACVLSACVCASGSAVVCRQPRTACRMSVVPETQGVTSVFQKVQMSPLLLSNARPPEGGTKTTLLLWFHLVNFRISVGMWSITRQLQRLSEKTCVWLSLLTLFSLPVIQEEGRWLLIPQRSPAGEPGGGWGYRPARLGSEAECGPPALPRRQ